MTKNIAKELLQAELSKERRNENQDLERARSYIANIKKTRQRIQELEKALTLIIAGDVIPTPANSDLDALLTDLDNEDDF